MRYAFIEGRPDPRAVPVTGLVAAAERILPTMADLLIQYPGNKGYVPLREIAARRFADREGVDLPVDNIALTTGSNQAIELIGRYFLTPGTPVLTEELTYAGTLNLLRGLRADIIPIRSDTRDGMDMDALDATLADLARRGKKPGFIYTIATNQNPTGAILTEPRRRRLLTLAQTHGVPIVEDDCYGDLIVDDITVPPALRALDPADSVLYVGSFSKIMGPGLRLGYFYAPTTHLDAILANRFDGGSSALAACLVAEYLRDNLWDHIRSVNTHLREKRDALLAALDRHLGDIATWTHPRGGVFIYITLPAGSDLARLRALATPRELDFTEGQRFDPLNRPLNTIRLSYAHVPLDAIEPGIKVLADCVRSCQPVPAAHSQPATQPSP